MFCSVFAVSSGNTAKKSVVFTNADVPAEVNIQKNGTTAVLTSPVAVNPSCPVFASA